VTGDLDPFRGKVSSTVTFYLHYYLVALNQEVYLTYYSVNLLSES